VANMTPQARAEVIARTETMRVYRQAVQAKAQVAGLDHFRMVGPMTTKTSNLCRTFNGRTLSADQWRQIMGDRWDLGENAGRGLHPNCRHSWQPVRPAWLGVSDGSVERTGAFNNEIAKEHDGDQSLPSYSMKEFLSLSPEERAKFMASSGNGFRLIEKDGDSASPVTSGQQTAASISTAQDTSAPTIGKSAAVNELATKAYGRDEVPDKWLVHGRSGKGIEDLETGNVIQLADKWEVAEQYAGDEGSMWMIKPSRDAKIFDATDDKQVASLWDKFNADYDKGRLQPDLEGMVQDYREAGDDGFEKFRAEVNPPNIVDTAANYDSQAFVSWMNESAGYDFAQGGIDRRWGAVFDTQKIVAGRVRR
jgi:hypothetical protein